MRRRQAGTTLVLVVVTLTALLGVAALAVDQGVLYLARERAQDSADAAALAGGQLLPDVPRAVAAANQILAVNNQEGAQFVTAGLTSPFSVTRDDGSVVTVGPGDSLAVSGFTDAPMAFAPAVGFTPTSQKGAADTVSVPAEAVVIVQTACGVPAEVGLVPFGLIGDEPNSSDPTVRYIASLLSDPQSTPTPQPGVYEQTTAYDHQPLVLKLNIWNAQGKLVVSGNMDPLQLGTSSHFESGISQLSSTPLTAGQSLDTQNNVTIGLAQDGLQARLAPSNTGFSHDYRSSPAYADWFFGNPSLPVDPSLPAVTDSSTGRSYSYHLDPNRQNPHDGHILLLPIISQSAKGSEGAVTVLAFASFFVEQPYTSYTEPAVNAIAQGRFIGMFLPGAVSGSCSAGGLDTPPRLVR